MLEFSTKNSGIFYKFLNPWTLNSESVNFLEKKIKNAWTWNSEFQDFIKMVESLDYELKAQGFSINSQIHGLSTHNL